jgi:hypothetical protein
MSSARRTGLLLWLFAAVYESYILYGVRRLDSFGVPQAFGVAGTMLFAVFILFTGYRIMSERWIPVAWSLIAFVGVSIVVTLAITVPGGISDDVRPLVPFQLTLIGLWMVILASLIHLCRTRARRKSSATGE